MGLTWNNKDGVDIQDFKADSNTTPTTFASTPTTATAPITVAAPVPVAVVTTPVATVAVVEKPRKKMLGVGGAGRAPAGPTTGKIDTSRMHKVPY
jgi:hypothetical protein